MKRLTLHFIRESAIIMIVLLCSVMQLTAQTDTTASLPQFLFPHFAKALVKFKTGLKSTALMNYNTVTERMIFYQNGNIMDLSNPETVDTIFLQNKRFVFIGKTFYEVVVNAPVSLFIQHVSELINLGKPAGYGTTSQTVAATSESQYYGDSKFYNLKLPENSKVNPSPANWVRKDYVMYRIKSVSQFLKIFPGNEAEIKQFIKQSKLNIIKIDDLKKLVNHCNELIK